MEVACAYEDLTGFNATMCSRGGRLSPLRERLLQEEARAQRLGQDLAEAATVGQMLVAQNEELQHEVDALRLQLQHQEHGLAGDHGDEHSPHGGSHKMRSTTPVPFRSATPSRCRVPNPRKSRAKTPVRSHSSHRRHSVHILAKEYDHDMQELIAENKRLTDKATQLKRGNYELHTRLEEVLCELAAQREHPDPQQTVGTAHLDQMTEFEIREDHLKSEIDAERARVWELEQSAEAARRESADLRGEVSALISECQEQQGHSEAQAEEISVLHERLQELADYVAARRLQDSAQALAEAERQPNDLAERSRIETYGRSLAIDIRSDLLKEGHDRPISPTDMRLLREVDELRAQLVNAEFVLQTREVYRPREKRPGGTAGGSGSSRSGHAPRAAAPTAAAGFAALQDVVRDAEERLTRRLSAVGGGWLLGAAASAQPGVAAGIGSRSPRPTAGALSPTKTSGRRASLPGAPPPRSSARRSGKDEGAAPAGSGKFLFGQSWPAAFRSG